MPHRTRSFPTRIDRFRTANGISPSDWARESGIPVSMLLRIRAGADINVETLARLVRGARRLIGTAVRASDLYDLGEDDAVSPVRKRPPRRKGRNDQRKTFDTALDRILLEEELAPQAFARAAGMTRHALWRLRAGRDQPSVSTLATLVRTLRSESGKPYEAGDLYDVGGES